MSEREMNRPVDLRRWAQERGRPFGHERRQMVEDQRTDDQITAETMHMIGLRGDETPDEICRRVEEKLIVTRIRVRELNGRLQKFGVAIDVETGVFDRSSVVGVDDTAQEAHLLTYAEGLSAEYRIILQLSRQIGED